MRWWQPSMLETVWTGADVYFRSWHFPLAQILRNCPCDLVSTRVRVPLGCKSSASLRACIVVAD